MTEDDWDYSCGSLVGSHGGHLALILAKRERAYDVDVYLFNCGDYGDLNSPRVAMGWSEIVFCRTIHETFD